MSPFFSRRLASNAPSCRRSLSAAVVRTTRSASPAVATWRSRGAPSATALAGAPASPTRVAAAAPSTAAATPGVTRRLSILPHRAVASSAAVAPCSASWRTSCAAMRRAAARDAPSSATVKTAASRDEGEATRASRTRAPRRNMRRKARRRPGAPGSSRARTWRLGGDAGALRHGVRGVEDLHVLQSPGDVAGVRPGEAPGGGSGLRTRGAPAEHDLAVARLVRREGRGHDAVAHRGIQERDFARRDVRGDRVEGVEQPVVWRGWSGLALVSTRRRTAVRAEAAKEARAGIAHPRRRRTFQVGEELRDIRA